MIVPIPVKIKSKTLEAHTEAIDTMTEAAKKLEAEAAAQREAIVKSANGSYAGRLLNGTGK